MGSPVEKEYDANGNITAIRCRSCHEMKWTEHYAKTWRKAAFNTQCKECKAIYDEAYRARTKERRAEKQKVYRQKHYDELILKWRERYKENPQKYIDASNNYRRKKVEENGFAWEWFHEQARKYVRKMGLSFTFCYRCDKEWKIELHHPSYGWRDMRKYVVPLCRSCHRYVEQHPEDCPLPIDLEKFKN